MESFDKSEGIKIGQIMKIVIVGMNGFAVARYGLILWENEAMGSRKVLKYLPGHKNGNKNINKYC